MATLTDEQIDELAEAIVVRMAAKNPGQLILRSLCDERTAHIKKLIYGLYGFMASIALLFVATIIASVYGGA